MGQSNQPQTPAERYRKRAVELRRMAEQAKTDEAKIELLVLAQQYEKLAIDLKRLQR